jgi:hypothetical protein
MTYYAAFERGAIPTVGQSMGTFFFGDSTDSISGPFGFGTPAAMRMDLVTATVAQAQVSVALASVGVVYKQASRYSTNYAIMAQNGVIGTPDTTVTMPANITGTIKAVGRVVGSPTIGQLGGWLRELRVYTSALPDAQLQALTL